MVTHTHNIDQSRQKGDVTAPAGWKGGKQELKGWISAIERVRRWKKLKVTVFKYRHELQEEQMGCPGVHLCDRRNDTREDTDEDVNRQGGWTTHSA